MPVATSRLLLGYKLLNAKPVTPADEREIEMPPSFTTSTDTSLAAFPPPRRSTLQV
jgi:hypothetical protein